MTTKKTLDLQNTRMASKGTLTASKETQISQQALSRPLKELSWHLKAQMFLNYMSRENNYFEEKLARSHN
jgi:hypothetical protein